MKRGDLVRFYHPSYHTEIVGIIMGSKPIEWYPNEITYEVLDFDGRILNIHTTIWPRWEIFHETG